MFLPALSLLAATISPLTITVTTKDGHQVAVPIADADATALRVCAQREGAADRTAVCAPVVNGRHGSTASLDVVDSGDLRFTVMSTRFEARSGAPAAVAIGFGVGTVISTAGAIVATAIATSTPADADADVRAASDVDAANARTVKNIAGGTAVVLWTGAVVGVVGTVVSTVIAVGDANTLE